MTKLDHQVFSVYQIKIDIETLYNSHIESNHLLFILALLSFSITIPYEKKTWMNYTLFTVMQLLANDSKIKHTTAY